MVSVILPTYNGSKWLKKAIESVLHQSYQDWELLVVDDGSTDNTSEIVAGFAATDLRIRYLRNVSNLGIQKSLNRGLREAKGEYIARIDDDDMWSDTDKLAEQVEFLNTHPEYILVGTGVVMVNENGMELFRYLLPQTDEEIKSKILFKNYFVHSSVLFRKDIVLSVGGYSEEESALHFEDYDLWLRIGTLGKFSNLPIYATSYRVRADSISSKNRVQVFKKVLSNMKKYKYQYKNYYMILIFLYVRFIAYSLYVKFFYKLPVNKLLKLYKEF